ncbi:endonuclease 4-like [Rutidosis leptorrhynchoides]|uniref:endonuclease 4-like n=1 Tax=Rutidosis leptorrhynchoides TaxID=125765 RepID=UPI003A990CB5
MSGFKLWWIKGTFAVLLLLIPGSLGWGKEGHYATCKIAQLFLSEEALKVVKELLPETAEGDLASYCSWADNIKWMNKWRWTSELHYVDTPDFRCNYNYCRDCHDSSGVKDRCVTGAIYNYTEQLVTYNASNSASQYNLTEALMFLSHYIGDVHQPLHVSFTSDEGGNTITVRWYKRKTNLHHVWDSDIIESAMKEFYDKDIDVMISAIEKNITDTWSNDISSWANCTSGEEVCPDPWASESIKCSCNYAYRNATPGSTLGDEYFLSRLPIVEMRLAQGGVRLAATLNRIFDPYSSILQKFAYSGNFIQLTSHTI